MNHADYQEFLDCLGGLLEVPEVQSMQNFSQHGSITCLGHCLFVAYIGYKICKKMKWNYRAAARGGLLHDMFLYDWRKDEHKGVHGFSHPKIACENAEKICDLSAIERDIILKHMWPLTFFQFYRYKESMAISCADKFCAILESLHVSHRIRFVKTMALQPV